MLARFGTLGKEVTGDGLLPGGVVDDFKAWLQGLLTEANNAKLMESVHMEVQASAENSVRPVLESIREAFGDQVQTTDLSFARDATPEGFSKLRAWKLSADTVFTAKQFADRIRDEQLIMQITFIDALYNIVAAGIPCVEILAKAIDFDSRELTGTTAAAVTLFRARFESFMRFIDGFDAGLVFSSASGDPCHPTLLDDVFSTPGKALHSVKENSCVVLQAFKTMWTEDFALMEARMFGWIPDWEGQQGSS